MEYGDIAHRCFRCGYCKFPGNYQDFNCPPYRQFGFDTYSSGGRMWLINAWLADEIQTSPRLAEILYSCVACANCQEQCVYVFKDNLLDIFESAKAELVDQGLIPPAVRDYFKAISVNGNPFKAPQAERGQWAEQDGLPAYDGQDYLFYVGCVGSYDEVGIRMARSVGALLKKAGLSIGILGPEENCDGNEVKILGEKGLFEHLARNNIELFREKGVRQVITLDPHALHAFKNEYPKLGGQFQARHYTEILAGLIREQKMTFKEFPAKVTYHDPCFLGRHNQIYEAPRKILRSIPGLELVEMGLNRSEAFCCGGGGGNFFTDILGTGENSANRIRAREALETGADILAVACPNCAKMLSDALKMEEAEDRMMVMDISEIAGQALAA